MIPISEVNIEDEIEEVEEPSTTYYIDKENNRISGMVDGLEAVKQAVYLILSAERFEHIIYTTDYGTESVRLIGAPASVLRSELGRSIKEALLQDDRISDVVNFSINITGDTADVRFTVVTVYGNFEEGVTRNV